MTGTPSPRADWDVDAMGKSDEWWLEAIWRLTDYAQDKDALRVLRQFKEEVVKAYANQV